MLSCGAPPPPTLAYSPSAVVVTVGSSLRQAPVVNAYCEYSVVPPLPDGLFLNGATGVVSGKSYAPLPATVFTVYAKHAESHALVNATLSLTVLGRAACLSVMLECSSPRHLVRVQWTSLYHSDIEQWELRANDTVVATRSGLDVGDQEVTQSELFCLSPAVYTLHQRLAPSQAPTKAGHLSLDLSLPFSDAFPDFQSIVVLPFAECGEAWSALPDTPFTSHCNAFSFDTRLLIDRDTEWRVSQAESVDKRWYSRRYEEDASWFTARPVDVSPSWNDVRFRHWFRVEKAAVESFDLFVFGASTVTLFLNGDWISRREMDEDVVRYRLSGDMFEDGDNLLAIAFASFYKEHAPAFSVLLQPVAQRANRLTYRDLELSSSPLSQPGYPPQALFDSNPYSEWRGVFECQKATLTVSFNTPSYLYLSEYCFTSSLVTVDHDPANWSVKARLTNGRWIMLSSMSAVHFFRRGEKRCFPVAPKYYPIVDSVQVRFESSWGQSYVQLSEIEFNTIALSRVTLPPFEYHPDTVNVIANVELTPIETPCAFYTSYFIEPSLPWGLSIDTGNGQVFGQVAKPFKATTFTVHAMRVTQEVVTTITLSFQECQGPVSLLHLQLDDVEAVSTFLSFQLSSSAVIASVQVPSQPSSLNFFFCVAPGLYTLQFVDKKNAGFLATHFSFEVDGVLVHSSYFNPGFSNMQFAFVAGALLPRQTPWYYAVDGQEPPALWYQTIDPVHEQWEVEKPGAFPAPQGRAQYFKTVMDVEAFPVDVSTLVGYVLEVRVKGGVCVYLNGKEVLRHHLPSGPLTAQTLPTSAFPEVRSIFATLSMQFAEWTDVVVVAAEVHDAEVQNQADFWMTVRVTPDDSPCEFIASVTSNVEPSKVTDLEAVFDAQYYDKMVVQGTCDDVQLFFDLQGTSYQYITELCLYTANTAGEYPHALALDGGVMGDAGMNGTVWEELFAEEDVWFPKVAYGVSQCFHFYNEKSYAQFRLRLRDCEHKNAMEVAEVEFFARRLDGYCVDDAFGGGVESVAFTKDARVLSGVESASFMKHARVLSNAGRTTLTTHARTPSGEWKDFGCPELYWGQLLRYCENSTWSRQVDYCRPIPPTAFKYPHTSFMVSRKQFVSITPSVVGAELFFTINAVPAGMTFNNKTGELSGFYWEEKVMTEVVVEVANPSGKQTATFALYVVNNHEDLLIIVAVLAFACLMLLIAYIVIAKGSSVESVQYKAELSHLHTSELPKNMLPLLV